MTARPERAASLYSYLVAEADAKLDDQLGRIRVDYEAGEITTREAADERCQVMQEHLDRVRELREEYLGPG